MLSPCKKVCKLVDEKCIECNRTINEIVAWRKLTDDERLDIMNRIKNER